MFGKKQRDDHGTARFATPAEIRRAGMLSPGGMVLGRLDGGWLSGGILCHNKEGHVLVSAPPGAGKTSGIVRPTLLTYPGSIFVTDIKGQSDSVHDMTVRRRAELKSEVHVLDPFGATDAPPAGVDLFSVVDPKEPMEGASWISSIIMPPRRGDGYFEQEGRSFVALLFAGIEAKEEPGEVRLARIRDFMQAPLTTLADVMVKLQDSPHPAVRNRALYFKEQMEKVPKQFMGAQGNASTACTFLDHPGIRRMLTSGTFDPRRMKDRSTTVYFVIAIERLQDYCAAARLVVELMLRRLMESRANPRNSVLLLLDEFANMGPMPRLVDSLTHTRSAGVRTALIVQSVGQLRSLYDQDKTQTIRDASQIQVYMDPNSQEDCEYISRRIGQETREEVAWEGFKWPWDFIKTGPRPVGKTVMIDWGHVAKTGWFGYNFGKDPRGMFQAKKERVWGRDLLKPDEIASLPRGTLFLFAQGLRPIMGRTVRDFADGDFRHLLGRKTPASASPPYSPPPPAPAAAKPSKPHTSPSAGATTAMVPGIRSRKKDDVAFWETTKDSMPIPIAATGVSESDLRNTSRRILTVFVLDVSLSMEQSGGLRQLNEGLSIFKTQLSSAARHVADRVDLSLVTFAGTVKTDGKSCNVLDWTPPVLKAEGGGTDLAGAIIRAFDVLGSRRKAFEEKGISVASRGYVFVITDGQPDPAPFMTAVPAARERIRNEVDEKRSAWFNAIGVDGADRELLASLREPGDAHHLPDCDFPALFKYLSKKSIDVSSGKIAEDRNPLGPAV